MGDIVRFPRVSSHARASSLEARRVSRSDVSPAVLASSVDRITDHHSDGILSRCHHFETAGARPPIPRAIASREGQSSMMLRNDCGESAMPHEIRQSVLENKDNVSGDADIPQGHTVLMKKAQPPASLFKDHFTARVAFARHKAGYTQVTMAEALGFGDADDPSAQGKYHKYEKRSLMPHHLIPQFCALCDVTVGWLYSGPVVARPVEKRGRKRKTAPERRVA
jgi:hypothetical protein